MKRKRYYYKVVYNDDGRLESAFIRGRAKVKYSVNCWVSAPEDLANRGFHLVVFNSKWRAENWAELRNGNNWQVFRCEVLGKADKPPFYNSSCLTHSFLNNVDYWRKHKETFQFLGSTWSKGSYFFKKVKLVKRVWPTELIPNKKAIRK